MPPEEVDICCCCFDKLDKSKEEAFVNFRYQIPGQMKPEQILIAVVCDPCAKESDDPKLFPVIEALINAKMIRLQHPDLIFTPKEW